MIYDMVVWLMMKGYFINIDSTMYIFIYLEITSNTASKTAM